MLRLPLLLLLLLSVNLGEVRSVVGHRRSSSVIVGRRRRDFIRARAQALMHVRTSDGVERVAQAFEEAHANDRWPTTPGDAAATPDFMLPTSRLVQAVRFWCFRRAQPPDAPTRDARRRT